MITTLIFAGTLAAAYFAVAVVRAIGLRRNYLDIPNERSSHIEPTPRGGGIAIVVISLGFYVAATLQRPGTFSWGYFAGALLVAGISLMDDLYSISAKWRILTHSIAALLVIFERGYLHQARLLGGGTLEIGAVGAVLTFIWIVWLVNAYNFMDGIDGIAGVQAVAASLGWVVIGWLTHSDIAFWLAAGTLFSTLGFLIHNWQPAKIFMGDVGSAFLGFSFAVMPLLATIAEDTDLLLPVAAVLLVWLFIFDTVITLGRRIFRREKVWRAHREHLYQRLVRSGWPHAKVSLLYGFLALGITVPVVVLFTSPESFYALPLIATSVATLALVVVYRISSGAKGAIDTK